MLFVSFAFSVVAMIAAIQDKVEGRFAELLALAQTRCSLLVGDGKGLTALHWAAHCDEPRMLLQLLQHPALLPTTARAAGGEEEEEGKAEAEGEEEGEGVEGGLLEALLCVAGSSGGTFVHKLAERDSREAATAWAVWAAENW